MQELLDALSNETRREIVHLVWSRERTAGDIAAHFSVSWPAISQNLRILRESEAISERREGTRRFYKANRDVLRPLEVLLEQMWSTDLDRLKGIIERDE